METEAQEVKHEFDAFTESFNPEDPYSFGRAIRRALDRLLDDLKQQQAAERVAEASISKASPQAFDLGAYRLGRKHEASDRHAVEAARAWARRMIRGARRSTT